MATGVYDRTGILFKTKFCKICGKEFRPSSAKQVDCVECKNMKSFKVCACGCGKIFEYSVYNKDKKFISGHNRVGAVISTEMRTKISKKLVGNKNGLNNTNRLNKIPWNKGKLLPPHTEETIKLMSKVRSGKTYEEIFGVGKALEVRRKQRLSSINRIKDRCGQCSPNYNSNACEFLDLLNSTFDIHIQHAMNGGEKCIAGYFVDGFEEDMKWIIEWDEDYHYDRNGILNNKDTSRQLSIHSEYPDYTFIRIKEKDVSMRVCPFLQEIIK